MITEINKYATRKLTIINQILPVGVNDQSAGILVVHLRRVNSRRQSVGFFGLRLHIFRIGSFDDSHVPQPPVLEPVETHFQHAEEGDDVGFGKRLPPHHQVLVVQILHHKQEH